MTTKHVINIESIHNWINYVGKLRYFDDLTPAARAEMVRQHGLHTDGTDCIPRLYALAARFPDEFEVAGRP